MYHTFVFQALTGVYLITFFGGYDLWKFSILGFPSSELFEAVMHGKFFKHFQGSLRLEKYLNFEGLLQESLKVNLP